MITRFKSPILVVLIGPLLSGCLPRIDNTKTEAEQCKISSADIYQNTPAWELAQAVRDQNTEKIAEIAKAQPKLLECHDPVYDQTLLIWAVGTERYAPALIYKKRCTKLQVHRFY